MGGPQRAGPGEAPVLQETMTKKHETTPSADKAQSAETQEETSQSSIDATIERILAADQTSRQRGVLDERARELSSLQVEHAEADGEQYDLFERRSLRRVDGLSTELEDVTEVEYRQLRLERVVLAGIYVGGQSAEAEHSPVSYTHLTLPTTPYV